MDYSIAAFAVSLLNALALTSILFVSRKEPSNTIGSVGFQKRKKAVKVFRPGSWFGAHLVNDLKKWADSAR